jgi:glucosyl-dolichyl phosphate glucuronosyltransferase
VKLQITVILCTYNRHHYLRKVLDCIALSVLPPAVDWEVLIVDNNSSDQTPEVAREFGERYPGRFRYIVEAKQGKSHALNTGIREARGDVLAFIDDDVTVPPTWLGNLTQSLNRGDWAGAGGRTLLADPVSPPRWLALSGRYGLGSVLAAMFDLGDQPCQLDTPPFGVNMAYRKEMFEKHGLFRADLGPRPGSEIRNEDTEFGRRLMAAGERLRYEPSAVVYHPAPKNRVRRGYFLRWFFDYGRAEILEIGRRPDVWGIQRRYLSISKILLTVMPVRLLRWMLSLAPPQRFFWKCIVWQTGGQIAEIYRQWGPAQAATPCASNEINAVFDDKT